MDALACIIIHAGQMNRFIMTHMSIKRSKKSISNDSTLPHHKYPLQFSLLQRHLVIRILFLGSFASALRSVSSPPT